MIKSIQDAEKDGSTNTAAAARVNEGASTTDEQDEATLAAMGLEAVSIPFQLVWEINRLTNPLPIM